MSYFYACNKQAEPTSIYLDVRKLVATVVIKLTGLVQNVTGFLMFMCCTMNAAPIIPFHIILVGCILSLHGENRTLHFAQLSHHMHAVHGVKTTLWWPMAEEGYVD